MMQIWQTLLYTFGVLYGFSAAVDIPPWANVNPSEWPHDNEECGGKKQSPIILDGIDSTWKPSDPDTKYEIKFENTDQKGNVIATNNGFYIYFIYTYAQETERPQVTMTYKGKPTTYKVFGANFRWPSEHEIPNKLTSLEMHIYAQNDKGDSVLFAYLFATNNTLNCDSPPCCTKEDTIYLGGETKAALNITNAGDDVTYEDSFGHLLPKNSNCGYLSYKGSYTIPPCTEGSLWLVYKRILCVEEETMKAFQSLEDNNGKPILENSRPLQSRNGRRIVDLACDNED